MNISDMNQNGVKIDGAPSLDELRRTPGFPYSVTRDNPLSFIECVE